MNTLEFEQEDAARRSSPEELSVVERYARQSGFDRLSWLWIVL